MHERFEQSGSDLRALTRLAGSGAGACFANALLISPNRREEPRWRGAATALPGDGLWVGVSELRLGSWSLRLVANDNLRLRHALREIRRLLAEHFPRLSLDARKL